MVARWVLRSVAATYVYFMMLAAAHAELRYLHNPGSSRLVVFVHGLCGSAEDTFSAPKPAKSWPEIMSGDRESLRGAPPLSTYAIATLSYPAGPSDTVSIPQAAASLAAEIRRAALPKTYREIHFIAHSLGGIVLKELLLDAPELRASTKSVLLVASPAGGSGLAEWANLPVISKFCGGRIVRDLSRIEDNSFLQSLNNRWINLARQKPESRPYIACAHETMEMNRVVVVVPGSRADQHCDQSEAINRADHINIVKPSSTSHPIYVWAADQIAYASTAHKEMATPQAPASAPAPCDQMADPRQQLKCEGIEWKWEPLYTAMRQSDLNVVGRFAQGGWKLESEQLLQILASADIATAALQPFVDRRAFISTRFCEVPARGLLRSYKNTISQIRNDPLKWQQLISICTAPVLLKGFGDRYEEAARKLDERSSRQARETSASGIESCKSRYRSRYTIEQALERASTSSPFSKLTLSEEDEFLAHIFTDLLAPRGARKPAEKMYTDALSAVCEKPSSAQPPDASDIADANWLRDVFIALGGITKRAAYSEPSSPPSRSPETPKLTSPARATSPAPSPDGAQCINFRNEAVKTAPFKAALAATIVSRSPIAIAGVDLQRMVKDCEQLAQKLDQQRAAELSHFIVLLKWSSHPSVDRPDAAEIIRGLAGAADAGSVLAAWDAGELYWHSKSQRSFEKSVHYLELAAKAGFAPAMIHLGNRYSLKDTPHRDRRQACDWYEKAALARAPLGQWLFGSCFVLGDGRGQDYATGIKWLKSVAEQGHPAAQTTLGYAYCKAPAPSGSRAECERWLKLAAKNGDRQATEMMRVFEIRP